MTPDDRKTHEPAHDDRYFQAIDDANAHARLLDFLALHGPNAKPTAALRPPPNFHARMRASVFTSQKYQDRSKYSGARLRELRAERGVGRPV